MGKSLTPSPGADKSLAMMSWQLVTITMVPPPHPSSNPDSPDGRRPAEPAAFRLKGVWIKRELRHDACTLEGTQLFSSPPLRSKALTPPSGSEIRISGKAP